MRILKKGRLEERKFTCDKCGCVFVADENDKKDITESWMDVDTDVCAVYCPYCEREIEWWKGDSYNGEEEV